MENSFLFAPGGMKSKELIKEALKELFLEEPLLLQDTLKGILSEFSERLEYTQMMQIEDRNRIADIELVLGLDEDLQDHVYRQENPESYQETIQKQEDLRKKCSFQALTQTQDSKPEDVLYEELKRTPSMKNKDIMNFFSWDKKNTMMATRLMRKMPEIFPDVVYESVPGKKRVMRIRLKN